MSAMEDFYDDHKDGFLAALLNLAIAIAIAIIGLIVIKLVIRAVRWSLTHQKIKMDETLVNFVLSVAAFLLKFILFIMVIDRIGIDTASFVAIIFSMTLALAFALQGLMSSFAAGFILITFKPIRVGERVSIGSSGQLGDVREIGMFNTTLISLDANFIVISNSEVLGNMIVNHAREPARRVDLVIGVGYGEDIAKAEAVLMSCMKAHDLVLQDPAPSVGVQSLGGSEVNLYCRPWCVPDDYLTVWHGITKDVKLALDKNEISIPFPQRDVHIIKESDVQESAVEKK